MTLLLEDGTGLLLEDGTSLWLEDGTVTPTPTGVYLRGPVKPVLRTVELDPTTLEALQLEVWCSDDPTGTPPGFAVTVEGTRVAADAAYTAGAWISEWGADGWVAARTPLFGDAFAVPSRARLWVWIKTSVGDESAVWQIGTVVVL